LTVFFGKRWNAPIVDEARQEPTPVGAACYLCERAIRADDQGFIRPLSPRTDLLGILPSIEVAT
jgi:hypothetical protein